MIGLERDNEMTKKQLNENLLTEELRVLQNRVEELKFYDEHNFEKLFDVTEETNNKYEELEQAIMNLIDRRTEDRKERIQPEAIQAWYHVSLATMNQVNKEIDELIAKINDM